MGVADAGNLRAVGRRRVAILALAVATVVAAGVLAAVAYDRWSCPSQAELERDRSPDEVVHAFAERGIELVQASPPAAIIGRARAYRGASAYRYVTERAALYVVVCRTRCVNAPPGLREARVLVAPGQRPQRLRQFSTLGNNIATFTTDNDGYSGRALHLRVEPALNELDAAVAPDSHCYIQ